MRPQDRLSWESAVKRRLAPEVGPVEDGVPVEVVGYRRRDEAALPGAVVEDVEEVVFRGHDLADEAVERALRAFAVGYGEHDAEEAHEGVYLVLFACYLSDAG